VIEQAAGKLGRKVGFKLFSSIRPKDFMLLAVIVLREAT
jgi:hypothetical protein